MTTYLDCNATTPLDPEVFDVLKHYLLVDYGNAGSRTHDFGSRAKRAVQKARDQVATVVGARRDEVVFTSGATESNNLAVLGLAAYGERTGRKHVVSTQIEHKAVLEPLQALMRRGFEVTFVPPTAGGWVDPEDVRASVRSDTLLVSVMQANNETGVLQPIEAMAALLSDHQAFLHVDAAQGFGKDLEPLKQPRVDLISISGHKVYAPKGVGALVMRRRGFERVPLEPLMYGGGQERGLRPGTVPVPLVAALGQAAEIAVRDHRKRRDKNLELRGLILEALEPLSPKIHGDVERVLPHVLNLSLPGVDSEAVMVALKGTAAISNGSACTSARYEPSHVLRAMGVDEARVQGALRISWCHLTEQLDLPGLTHALRELK